MTQSTPEQREHVEAVAAQATAKLEAFRDGLTAEERAVLRAGLWQAMADTAGADESVRGFVIMELIEKAAKQADKYIDYDPIPGFDLSSRVKAAWDWLT